MINRTAKANRLINEKSPYLLQHAYNPVDWTSGEKKPLPESGKGEQAGIFVHRQFVVLRGANCRNKVLDKRTEEKWLIKLESMKRIEISKETNLKRKYITEISL